MKFILTLWLAVTISGCAMIQAKPPKIAPKSIYKLEQATLLSPNQSDWSVMKHELHSAVFAKNYDTKAETAIISAMMYKVGAFKKSRKFLQHIAEQRVKQDDKDRFKNLSVKNKYVTFKELPCLKYQTLAEDHRNKGIDSKDFEYFKTSGYICRYPLEYIAFQIEVSHRSKQKELPKDLLKAGEEFFKNIQLVKGTIKRLKTIP